MGAIKKIIAQGEKEIKEEKVERDTPPVLLKETYYFSDGSNKKICIEHSTTIYKYNKDGLFIRSNQYFTSGISTESLEKIENDDWSQKYVEYDESGKLIATLRDDGENTRYANIIFELIFEGICFNKRVLQSG